MTTLTRYFTLGAALVALALPSSVLAKASVGQPAPDFTLTDLKGESHQLSQYAGRTVVLEWVNPECPFVVRHYGSGNLPKLQKAAADDGVVWLTINSGAPGQQGVYEPAKAQDWMSKKGAAPKAYLQDGDGKVGRLYQAKTTPHMYVINPDGVLVYDGAIDSSPRGQAGAEDYVTAALTAVRDGGMPAKGKTEPYGCGIKY